MKHIFLIVGEELQLNRPFMNYILRKYEENLGQIAMISYVGDNDKNLPFYIENYSRDCESVTIISNETNFYTISKILATLSSDTIELKGDILIPSRATLQSKDIFLLNLNDANITLIKATPTQNLPKFSIDLMENVRFFYLIDVDIESAKILLEPLSSTYNVTTNLTAILPNLTYIKAKTSKYGGLDGFFSSVENLFANKFIPSKDLINFVAKILLEKDLKITFAESCTAGLCAAKFGEIAGVSKVFDGSVVTYANHIKSAWVDVSSEILENFGAVSQECVKAMAKGALRLANANFSIAISGVAGPDGGSEEKPVGCVYIAVCDKNGTEAQKLTLNGDRNYIREQSMLSAFVLLLKKIL